MVVLDHETPSDKLMGWKGFGIEMPIMIVILISWVFINS
jgi:hypothetical protein